MTRHSSTAALADLERRFSRALERGKGIRLEQADLERLAKCGAYEALAAAASAELKALAETRMSERASKAAPHSFTSRAIEHLREISDAESSRQAVERARRRGLSGAVGATKSAARSRKTRPPG